MANVPVVTTKSTAQAALQPVSRTHDSAPCRASNKQVNQHGSLAASPPQRTGANALSRRRGTGPQVFAFANNCGRERLLDQLLRKPEGYQMEGYGRGGNARIASAG